MQGRAGTDRSGHEKNSKLMAQLDVMLKLLKQIDSVEIPPNDFDAAWDHKVDIARNKYTNPTRPGVAVIRPTAVRGSAKTDAATLEVSLTSTAEKTAEEEAQQAARKAELETQNALPVWHTQSTVKTEAGNVSTAKTELGVKEEDVDVKPDIKGDQKPDVEDLDDKVAAYYAEMEREKEREAKEEEEEDEADEDEDEDDFEDVGVTPNGSVTPQIESATKSPAATNGSLKRELESETGSSAPQTTVGTPVTPADEGPVVKKVKIEEPSIKKEESDDEDEEFEDV